MIRNLERGKHHAIKLLPVIFVMLLFSSCPNPSDSEFDSSSSDLRFNVSNAKAIAGYSGAASRDIGGVKSVNRASSLATLVKIKADGTLQSAISFPSTNNNNWTPDVSFISIGEDQSVYICFSQPYQSWQSAGQGQSITTTIQFVRVYPDNHFDVLWPLEPLNYRWNIDGQVNTWTWPGMDSDPLQKGDDGQLYFKVSSYSGNTNSDSIYSYNPNIGGKPVLRTPQNSSLSIESFKVDSRQQLFIKSQNYGNGQPSYMRYYRPNITAPVNIYYSSTGDVWVRGYANNSTGDSILLNGNNINGMSGIIRANLKENGLPTYDVLYSTRFYNGMGVYLQQVQNGPLNQNALIKYDYQESKFKWDDSVLTNGFVDKAKLLSRVESLFVSSPSLKEDRFALLPQDVDSSSVSSVPIVESNGTLGSYPSSYSWVIANWPDKFLRAFFNGKLIVDWITENGFSSFDTQNILTMTWANDNSLLGLYVPYYWNSSSTESTRIIKLLDSSGRRALDLVTISHGNEKPSRIKIVGEYLYYRYSVLNGTMETGYHKLARFNLSTRQEEELLTDLYLANRNLELQTYDISSDGMTMYISALDYDTNVIIFGKIDLGTKVFTKIESDSRFNTVRTF